MTIAFAFFDLSCLAKSHAEKHICCFMFVICIHMIAEVHDAIGINYRIFAHLTFVLNEILYVE